MTKAPYPCEPHLCAERNATRGGLLGLVRDVAIKLAAGGRLWTVSSVLRRANGNPSCPPQELPLHHRCKQCSQPLFLASMTGHASFEKKKKSRSVRHEGPPQGLLEAPTGRPLRWCNFEATLRQTLVLPPIIQILSIFWSTVSYCLVPPSLEAFVENAESPAGPLSRYPRRSGYLLGNTATSAFPVARDLQMLHWAVRQPSPLISSGLVHWSVLVARLCLDQK